MFAARRAIVAAIAVLFVVSSPTFATSAPTFTVVDLRPGAADSFALDSSTSYAFGDYVYFAADDGVHGSELWRSNGDSTEMVEDINAGASSSSPNSFVSLGSYIYFYATDPVNGREIWRSDGTSAGTEIVGNVELASTDPSAIPPAPRFAISFYSVQVRTAEVLDGVATVAVTIRDGTSDDSAFATVNVTATDTTSLYSATFGNYGTFFVPGTFDTTFTLPCDTTFTLSLEAREFSEAKIYVGPTEEASRGWAYAPSGNATYSTSGEIPCDTLGADQYGPLVPFGSYVYFNAGNDIFGPELWRTDGSTVELVTDLYVGANGANPQGVTPFGDWLYFSANDGSSGAELWRTNGSTAENVLDINSGSNASSPNGFSALGDWLYFSANDGSSGAELWRTNGSTTERVADINSGAGDSAPSGFAAFGSALYFSADDGVSGTELWRTDGTITERVADINAGGSSSFPGELTQLGSYLYFRADDTTHGQELWRTDGVTTELAADTLAGSSGGSPEFLTVLGDYLYVVAYYPLGTAGPRVARVNGTNLEWVPFSSNASQYLDCDCYDTSLVVTTTRLFVPVYSAAMGHEFAFIATNLELPATNVDTGQWFVALALLSGLSAAACCALLRGYGLELEGDHAAG